HISFRTLDIAAHKAPVRRTSTTSGLSRELRRALLWPRLAFLQLGHLAFEPAQPALENVRLGGLHGLFQPAQESQEPRPAALWARVVSRIAQGSSIRGQFLTCETLHVRAGAR